MRYRKKPVVIEAEQLTYDNWGDVCDLAPVGRALVDGEWTDAALSNDRMCRGVWVHPTDNSLWSDEPGAYAPNRIGLIIPTLEGDMLAVEGDWIIKGVEGEFYPCKPDIFAKTYEEAE